MYSLFIDSHDIKVSIILYKDGKVLDKVIKESNNKHSTVLMPTIRDVIKNNNITVNDLNEILVINGPGSFTGERIAVTVAKTMAYCLDIPIKVMDALSVIAFNVDSDDKYVSIPDRNGAFVGHFDKNNNVLDDFSYINKSEYEELCSNNTVYHDIDIDYDVIYSYFEAVSATKAHEVKPLYIKGISALNDK